MHNHNHEYDENGLPTSYFGLTFTAVAFLFIARKIFLKKYDTYNCKIKGCFCGNNGQDKVSPNKDVKKGFFNISGRIGILSKYNIYICFSILIFLMSYFTKNIFTLKMKNSSLSNEKDGLSFDPYEILGITESTPEKKIKRRYLRLLKPLYSKQNRLKKSDDLINPENLNGDGMMKNLIENAKNIVDGKNPSGDEMGNSIVKNVELEEVEMQIMNINKAYRFLNEPEAFEEWISNQTKKIALIAIPKIFSKYPTVMIFIYLNLVFICILIILKFLKFDKFKNLEGVYFSTFESFFEKASAIETFNKDVTLIELIVLISRSEDLTGEIKKNSLEFDTKISSSCSENKDDELANRDALSPDFGEITQINIDKFVMDFEMNKKIPIFEKTQSFCQILNLLHRIEDFKNSRSNAILREKCLKIIKGYKKICLVRNPDLFPILIDLERMFIQCVYSPDAYINQFPFIGSGYDDGDEDSEFGDVCSNKSEDSKNLSCNLTSQNKSNLNVKSTKPTRSDKSIKSTKLSSIKEEIKFEISDPTKLSESLSLYNSIPKISIENLIAFTVLENLSFLNENCFYLDPAFNSYITFDVIDKNDQEKDNENRIDDLVNKNIIHCPYSKPKLGYTAFYSISGKIQPGYLRFDKLPATVKFSLPSLPQYSKISVYFTVDGYLGFDKDMRISTKSIPDLLSKMTANKY